MRLLFHKSRTNQKGVIMDENENKENQGKEQGVAEFEQEIRREVIRELLYRPEHRPVNKLLEDAQRIVDWIRGWPKP